MKDLSSIETLPIPEGVEIKLKSRVVTVTGPRGTLTKAVKHIQMDIQIVKSQKGNQVVFTVWHGNRKHVACLRTVKSMVSNMFTGVTKGFEYKMRLVYAHFPINPVIGAGGKDVEIRNFLGEKVVRKCPMLEGVTIAEGSKDELVISGNDIENVSQSAASITDKCRVKEKDIRKFLDGIYTSERGTVVKDTI
ncbi:putative 60S ribosomal protein l9 [Filobasidium floriforme]|uniref:putative 60S ribosomal protein l9 n=1 Tax=Filobasidium floriforme TaxID=5210 RepID=UPI001E8DF1F1|nr:putative 60S ribosomal protein l9 [Filobasidium floriforme]KAH8089280.1 putative 60S ribosomal protein l9 [Filobasidium floriforme]